MVENKSTNTPAFKKKMANLTYNESEIVSAATGRNKNFILL